MPAASPRDFGPLDVAVLAVAVGGFGLAFGATAVAFGLSPGKTVLLSIVGNAGAGQLGVLAVLSAGGLPITAIATGMLIGARYVPLGVAVAPRLPASLGGRLRAAHLLVDASAALAVAAPDDRAGRRVFWRVGLTLFLVWTGGTALGAFGGRFVTDVKAFGLDTALPALLVGILAPLMRDADIRRAALFAAAVALVLHLFTPAGAPVLVGAAAGFGLALGMRRRDDRRAVAVRKGTGTEATP